jgi:hypothetical protein
MSGGQKAMSAAAASPAAGVATSAATPNAAGIISVPASAWAVRAAGTSCGCAGRLDGRIAAAAAKATGAPGAQRVRSSIRASP